MRTISATFLVILLLFFAISCSKKNDAGNTKPPVDSVALLKSELLGKWNTVKLVATGFQYYPTIPSDTIFPTHSEYFDFSADSIQGVGWESMSLDETKSPPVFTVTQNVEFQGTVAYTVPGSDYFVRTEKSFLDTVHIVSISPTQMEVWNNAFSNTSGSYGWRIYTWFQR